MSLKPGKHDGWNRVFRTRPPEHIQERKENAHRAWLRYLEQVRPFKQALARRLISLEDYNTQTELFRLEYAEAMRQLGFRSRCR